MVKSNIISATKANRLYWLGRYEMRVYLTLHMMNKCCDAMIDGSPDAYMEFWTKLDASGNYKTPEEFTAGMLFDETNPCSVISAQKMAMDNAMLLREDIMSETLSYLEMSLAYMKKRKAIESPTTATLQPVIDWSLAFWGSAEQRIHNHKALDIVMIGRNIENTDILLRFSYPFRRIIVAYDSLKRYCSRKDSLIDEHVEGKLKELFTEDKYTTEDTDYRFKAIKYVNQLVRV